MSGQAQSRNVNRPVTGIISNLAGPCTDMILYECAASAAALATSGRQDIAGVRSAGGVHKNYFTGLEAKFAGETLKASVGMKRSEANELVKTLLPRYGDKLRNPPVGKSFLECFDLKTMTPSKEYMDIYYSIRKELIDLGMPY